MMHLKYYIFILLSFFIYVQVTNAYSTSFSKTLDGWTALLKGMSTFFTNDGDNVLPIFDDYLSKYIGNSNKLAILMDYDGTLTSIAGRPELATLPVQTKRVLERLSKMSNVYIAIISGRNVNNVKDMVGIEGITYAGNHGLEIHFPDGSEFNYPVPKEYEEKVSKLSKSLQDQVCKDGAWVENKGPTLTFHYREVPLDLHTELVSKAQFFIERAGFKANQALCAVEAKPPVKWNKGHASLYILSKTFGLDWSDHVRTIYAGDDKTDEDAMLALKGRAATFRVTQSNTVKTYAERRLPTTDAVLSMLKWVERHFGKRLSREDSVENFSNNLQPQSGEIQIEHDIPEKKLSLNNTIYP